MEKRIMFSLKGGSSLYGLETSSSDRDMRGVFVGVEPNIYRRGNTDSLYLRLDRALESVARSTQTAEFFYADRSKFAYVRDDFYNVAMGQNARFLIDSNHLYQSYESYVIKHIEIGAGLRLTKKADSKTNLLFAKYGHVPKGFVHAIRAARQVTHWLETSYHHFPSDLSNFDHGLTGLLRDVKTNPLNYSKDILMGVAVKYYGIMKDMRAIQNKVVLPCPEYTDFILKYFGQNKIESPSKQSKISID